MRTASGSGGGEEYPQGSTVEVGTPGGWKARLTGDTKVLLVALMVVSFGFLIFWLRGEAVKTEDETRKLMLGQHANTQSLLQSAIHNQDAIIKLLKDASAEKGDDKDEIIYVLTRTQAQREQLNLEMPLSLRKKINSSSARGFGRQ